MTLLELFELLRKHLKFVIILAVACVLVCAVACIILPNKYTAQTSMYILAQSDGTSQNSNNAYTDLNASQMLANDAATIAKSDRVKGEVASTVGLDNLDAYSVSVESSTTTRIITLSVTGTDAQQTAAIANAYVNVISNTVKSVMDVKSVNAISQAQTPEKPSGPNRPLYIFLALLLGLFLAIVIVVIRDMANTKARTDDDISELLNVPVIGHFPSLG